VHAFTFVLRLKLKKEAEKKAEEDAAKERTMTYQLLNNINEFMQREVGLFSL
jgi:hypothetical protein